MDKDNLHGETFECGKSSTREKLHVEDESSAVEEMAVLNKSEMIKKKSWTSSLLQMEWSNSQDCGMIILYYINSVRDTGRWETECQFDNKSIEVLNNVDQMGPWQQEEYSFCTILCPSLKKIKFV